MTANNDICNQIETINLKRIIATILAVYVLFVVAFFFLSGEQLVLRQSRGNTEMPPANSATAELADGTIIEQRFQAEIQRLDTISLLWGSYYRVNSGTVSVELWNSATNELLMSQQLDATVIEEGAITSMTSDTPIEGVYDIPLLLKIYSNSPVGQAVTLLMNTDKTLALQDSELLCNGAPIEGALCFSATGEDYIWTGIHYWEFIAAGFVLLAVYLGFVVFRYKKGKSSLLINAAIQLKRYKFLINQLVARDFKAKYKRSVLGVLWSFLNPLLTMLVQYIVFSNLFKFDIKFFPVYLLCGGIMFNAFSESCGMTLSSITGNASLITKVYMPKYVYPLTRTLSSAINLIISLIPLFVVALISGLCPTKAWLLVIIALVLLVIFSFGFGMLLASLMVFFRDTQFLWGVISMIWMYLTPIFYPISILPEQLAWVLKANPLYYYIQIARSCIIDGISPEPTVYIWGFVYAVGMLALGSFVFKKTQDKFVLYL